MAYLSCKPITTVFNCSVDFKTLVRLRVTKKSPAENPNRQGTQEGAEAAGAAITAMSSLHQLIMDIDLHLAEARTGSVLEVLSAEVLHILCQKSIAGKIFKGLMPLQNSLGFSLGDVKSCISLVPLSRWELSTALQTAVIKALTGNSTGACRNCTANTDVACSNSWLNDDWMCLSKQKLIGCNVFQQPPGLLARAPFLEFEATAHGPNKLLMTIKAAGDIKFRPFSPMQALAAEAKKLIYPLVSCDTDQLLLQDPAKLAAACRQLDGRAVKLLPDDRIAYIKSLSPCPVDLEQLQQLTTYWQGQYGLQLPSSWPFMVGVAAHPEAEDAELMVPSCCILTNLGMSVLPGSQPGLAASVQLDHVKQQPEEHQAKAAVAPAPPKHFSFSNSWTTAKEVGKQEAAHAKEAAAGAAQGTAGGATPEQLSTFTSATTQLMGLQDYADTHTDAQKPGYRQRNLLSSNEDYSKLKGFLAERANQQSALNGSAPALSTGGHDGTDGGSNSSINQPLRSQHAAGIAKPLVRVKHMMFFKFYFGGSF
eukprot:gene11747-11893_t